MKRNLLLPFICAMFAIGFQSCDKAPEREVSTVESNLKAMEKYNTALEFPSETKEIDSLFIAAKKDIKQEDEKLFKDFGKIKANLYYILRKQEKIIAEAKEGSEKVEETYLNLYADFLAMTKGIENASSERKYEVIKGASSEIRDVSNDMLRTASLLPNKTLTNKQKMERLQEKTSEMAKIREVMMKYIDPKDLDKYREEALRDIEVMNY